jgi:hypothetical protein
MFWAKVNVARPSLNDCYRKRFTLRVCQIDKTGSHDTITKSKKQSEFSGISFFVIQKMTQIDLTDHVIVIYFGLGVI